MRASIAWKNGHWLPFEQVHLGLDDWGVIQGAVLVARLRTMDQRVLDPESHFERLRTNCAALGIVGVDFDALRRVALECAQHNCARTADADFSIVVLVTPGNKAPGSSPTVIVHVQRLNWSALKHWYTHGQQLVIANHRNVPAECWSPQIKTRARLQYYLADAEASQRGELHAGAVLLDTAGSLTETSAANLIVVDREGRLSCAPRESILGGISLARTLRLAEAAGLRVVRRPIDRVIVESAREIILTGTSGCLWAASKIGEVEFPESVKRPIYCELRSRWIADVSFDFCQQAIEWTG